MSDKSAIEWTDATWNPVTGCTRVSPGCANCYIERTPPFRIEGRRFERVGNEETTGVRLHQDRLDIPLRWQKPRRVFVCSLSDLFHEQVPDDYIHSVFRVIERAEQHTFQILTKRPERARALLHWLYTCSWCEGGGCSLCDEHNAPHGMKEPLPNVWIGVSIENARYTWRADVLREIPAAVRFISAEPLLGSLFALGEKLSGVSAVMARKPLDLTDISWVIVGGESGGRNARPMHPDWARELRDACMLERVCIEHAHGLHPRVRLDCAACALRPAFFFKQYGSWRPAGIGDVTNARIHVGVMLDGRVVSPAEAAETPGAAHMIYAGASPKAGGRHLDGRTWNEMPGFRKEGMVGKYHKKPVVIEAVQWDGNNYAALRAFVGEDLDEQWSVGGYCFINTLGGRVNVYVGDWIIRGVKGEFYPCKPEVFDATYEKEKEGEG